MDKSSHKTYVIHPIPQIHKSFNTDISKIPSGESDDSSGDYQLTFVRVTDPETPPKTPPESPSPRLPPVSDRVNLEQEFENIFRNEVNHWGNKYHDPMTGAPGDPEFKRKIDNYVAYRQQVMELKDQGVPPEDLVPHFHKLGTLLPDAFGMFDPETNDWSGQVRTAVEQGAWEYAQPSVRSFCITQAPGIVKPLASYLATLFAGDYAAGVAKHVVNFAYPFFQVPLSIWASQKNGYWQSEAVQLQKRANPTWTPNVVSSKIIEEDGTDGELRSLSDVDEDLDELRRADELLKRAAIGELKQGCQQVQGRSLLARAELLDVLTRVTKSLGALQRSGDAAPPNKIERALLDDGLTLSAKMELLSKVTSGRAALRVPERQRIKRLLKQLDQWDILQNEFEAAVKTHETGRKPDSSPALKKMLAETAFERVKVFHYRMLNVVSNQAFVRDIRTCFFMGSTLAQLCGQVAEYITGNELALVTSDEIQAITGLVQAIVYAREYPKGIAKDVLSKLATQWQIIAMTGTGNFIGKDGKVDPKKLDKAVTGPVMTRLSTFASLLQFDKSVYTQALFGWMIDRQTLDDDEAEKVEVRIKYKVKVSSGVEEERAIEGDISCTYASLSQEFAKLDKPENRDARKQFVDQVMDQRLLSPEDKAKVNRILQLYEDNEINLANRTTASKLLGEESTLPPRTREILQGSLDCALPASRIAESIRKENATLDRELFVRAGKIEQRGELPSQAAQKLGQAFAWGLAGTGGFLFIKSICTLGVQIAILNGDLTEQAAESLASDILAGKLVGNFIALASTVFSLGLNHAYHEYIATKNLQRQNAAGGASIVNAPSPSLIGAVWRDFLEFIGIEDALVEEVESYDTLVGTPIHTDDRPPKLKFVRQSTLTEAMWEQMFAADVTSFGSWRAYFKQKQGTLEASTEADRANAIALDVAKIKKLVNAVGSKTSSAEIQGIGKTDRSSISGDQKIEELEPKVPPLNMASVASSPSRPQSPRERHEKVLTPRTKTRRERLTKAKAVHSLYKGMSRIGNQRMPIDPAETQDLRDEAVRPPHEAAYMVDRAREIRVNAPSKLMSELQWRESGGVHVAHRENEQENVFYVSQDPTKHGNPIRAFTVPDDNGRGLLHIADRKFPSLAVSNMLQLELGGNKNWTTLTTDDDFALFFQQHLRVRSLDQSTRIAAMPMEDLATFSQQMALQNGRAWWPMTTAKVRYVPEGDVLEETIQSAGTPLPLLHPEHAFGVTYEAFDPRSGVVRNSVMLRYDRLEETYLLVDPTSSKIIGTGWNEPMHALAWFMDKISSDHADVVKNMTFTVLYHVPPQAPNEEPAAVRVQLVLDDASTIAFDWLGKTADDVAAAQQQMATVCHQLEAENSWRLWRRADEDADQVMQKRNHIAKLHTAHSILASTLEMPPLPRPSDAVLPLVED